MPTRKAPSGYWLSAGIHMVMTSNGKGPVVGDSKVQMISSMIMIIMVRQLRKYSYYYYSLAFLRKLELWLL